MTEETTTDYKVPRRYAFVCDLPRNAMGKVDRDRLGRMEQVR
ncbi:MAG: hypothetical protein ACRDQA_01555 [Nocardioidaceae bacterium]